jgi:hypothetical protein
MAWKRNIPFGYRMEKGDIIPHEEEADAVVFIYEGYIDGESYKAIASAMSELGIRYYEGADGWNKHMIKRIIENRKYIEHGEYPSIISADIWNRAQAIRDSKMSGFKSQPLCIETIKRRFYCGECNCEISKDTFSQNGNRWWHCSNPECGAKFTLQDNMLEAVVITLMNRLIATPELIEPQNPIERTVSLEAARIQNEINRELNKTDVNEEYLNALILGCASEKYAILDDGEEQRKVIRLKADLQKQPLLTVFDATLFNDIVNAVLVMANNTITLRIAGGNIITENIKENLTNANNNRTDYHRDTGYSNTTGA